MFPKLEENYRMFQTLTFDPEGTFVFPAQKIRSSPTLKKSLCLAINPYHTNVENRVSS